MLHDFLQLEATLLVAITDTQMKMREKNSHVLAMKKSENILLMLPSHEMTQMGNGRWRTPAGWKN